MRTCQRERKRTSKDKISQVQLDLKQSLNRTPALAEALQNISRLFHSHNTTLKKSHRLTMQTNNRKEYNKTNRQEINRSTLAYKKNGNTKKGDGRRRTFLLDKRCSLCFQPMRRYPVCKRSQSQTLSARMHTRRHTQCMPLPGQRCTSREGTVYDPIRLGVGSSNRQHTACMTTRYQVSRCQAHSARRCSLYQQEKEGNKTIRKLRKYEEKSLHGAQNNYNNYTHSDILLNPLSTA